MTSLQSSNLSFPPTCSFSRTAIERRRRPLTLFFGVCVAVLLLSGGSQWPEHGIVREILFLMGACLATIGMLGRTWSNLFISGYKTTSLIESGPYSMCRNPLYFFSAIGLVGIGFCSGTFMIPLMMFAFFAVYYPAIIRCEEQRMAATHPEDFQKYRNSTPAFWPRIRNYQEPETYVVFPPIVRKHITDATWFLVLAALTHVVSELHDSHLLPTCFRIW